MSDNGKLKKKHKESSLKRNREREREKERNNLFLGNKDVRKLTAMSCVLELENTLHRVFEKFFGQRRVAVGRLK